MEANTVDIVLHSQGNISKGRGKREESIDQKSSNDSKKDYFKLNDREEVSI